MSERFVISRVGRLRGWATRYHAYVSDSISGAELEARSIEIAENIAHLLNKANLGLLPPHSSPTPSISRYSARADPNKSGRTLVVRAQSFSVEHVVARTRDAQLARRLAELLSRADPYVLRAPPRGVGAGWW